MRLVSGDDRRLGGKWPVRHSATGPRNQFDLLSRGGSLRVSLDATGRDTGDELWRFNIKELSLIPEDGRL